MSGSPARELLVLVNPSAGGVDDADEDGAAGAAPPEGPIADALEALRGEGGDTASISVEVVDDAQGIRSAVDRLPPDGLLVVVGGDGTLHRTINALPDRADPYLLIPAGTGNDFAGGLGLPDDLVEAARIHATGRATSMDVLEVGDVVAVNAAHLGVGVQAAEAASDLKGALGKLAYPAGAVAAATRFEPTVVTIEVDGDVVIDGEPVAMVALCNGPTVGGGTALCPGADPGDGLIDVVVLLATTGPALAATATALLRGRHLDREDVLHLQGTTVRVRVHDAETATWNVDGELLDRPADLRCRLRPQAWSLLLP